MAFQAIAWVFRQQIRPASLKLTLLALAECANSETLMCFPSTKYICKFTSLDRKTVLDCMQKIRDMGFITYTGNNCGKTKSVKIYRFNMGLTNSPENGTASFDKQSLFSLEAVESTDMKQSQKRDTEPVTITLKEPKKKFNDFEVRLLEFGVSTKDLRWFGDTDQISLSDNPLILKVKTNYARDKIEQWFSGELSKAFGLGKWMVEVNKTKSKLSS